MVDSVHWYNTHAADVAARYEGLSFEAVHQSLLAHLPDAPGLVLDVGAGSGRDAAYLAGLGHEVIAVEPAVELREEARRRHPSTNIRWLDDKLPELLTVSRLNICLDLILLSAVWMHLPPEERGGGFSTLMNLLKPGGVLAISLRHGPPEPDRGMYAVSTRELEELVAAHGARVVGASQSDDRLGRSAISWSEVIIAK